MIVEFFKCLRSSGDEPVPQFLAIMENKVLKFLECSTEFVISPDNLSLSDYEKIAEIDFLETETEAVETLVDALVSSGILIKNSSISGESALYILVNETLVVLQSLMDDHETVTSEDFSLTEIQ